MAPGIKKINRSFMLLVLMMLAATGVYGQKVTLTNYTRPLRHLIDSMHVKERDLRLLVSKSSYILSVMIGDRTIKSFPVVLGTNPVEDKLCEGDRCTPEGIFHIKAKYPHRSWSKFIWFDYPTAQSWTKHRQAKQQKKIASTTTIGGEVGIHGVPQGLDAMIDRRENWTWGCISLKNADVNEIYDVVFVGMKLEVIH
jgi:murein L,D-transpeptidase YafK